MRAMNLSAKCSFMPVSSTLVIFRRCHVCAYCAIFCLSTIERFNVRLVRVQIWRLAESHVHELMLFSRVDVFPC